MDRPTGPPVGLFACFGSRRDGYAGSVETAQIALFGFGYPVSVAVLSRFVAVVRERRWRWLAVHHLAVAAIIGGWATRREAGAVALNATWLVASSAWYVLGRPRS